MRRQNTIQNQTNVKQRQTKQHTNPVTKHGYFGAKYHHMQKHCITFESDHEATQYDNAAPIEREAAIDTTGNTLIYSVQHEEQQQFQHEYFHASKTSPQKTAPNSTQIR
eukprot:663313_1